MLDRISMDRCVRLNVLGSRHVCIAAFFFFFRLLRRHLSIEFQIFITFAIPFRLKWILSSSKRLSSHGPSLNLEFASLSVNWQLLSWHNASTPRFMMSISDWRSSLSSRGSALLIFTSCLATPVASCARVLKEPPMQRHWFPPRQCMAVCAESSCLSFRAFVISSNFQFGVTSTWVSVSHGTTSFSRQSPRKKIFVFLLGASSLGAAMSGLSRDFLSSMPFVLLQSSESNDICRFRSLYVCIHFLFPSSAAQHIFSHALHFFHKPHSETRSVKRGMTRMILCLCCIDARVVKPDKTQTPYQVSFFHTAFVHARFSAMFACISLHRGIVFLFLQNYLNLALHSVDDNVLCSS